MKNGYTLLEPCTSHLAQRQPEMAVPLLQASWCGAILHGVDMGRLVLTGLSSGANTGRLEP
jgi:hypothetical protein